MTGLEPASFEVDRFERTEAGLEVSGRWFGVRGRRFMRPALTTSSGGSEQRMLAVLDHKPWVAEEGETWLAAFPCSSDPAALDQAELTVAPDVTVALPAPSSGPVHRRRPRRADSRGASARSGRPTAGTRRSAAAPTDEHETPASQLRVERDEAVRSRDDALAALEEARRTGDRAADRSERERDHARAARDEATRERDETGREREAARAERDNVQHERNRMLAERDTARARVHETTRQWELTAELGTRRTVERDAVAVERDRLA
ncbi:MAG: hypothetical protein QOF54_1337, partial [Solirubrobacteraceae bacterium]|nr:hypothetical protein [Solirubrobacteraceae bacterium]